MTADAAATISSPSMPAWARVVAAGGLLWSLFGLYQFASTAFASEAALRNSGMTAEQAALYVGLPSWMTVVFATGVLGGVLGCVLLLLGRRLASAVLLVSLLAYLALYAGDYALGVFAAFGPPQVAVLTTVVLIAAALLFLARRLSERGALR